MEWERFRSGSISAPVAVAIESIPVAEGQGVAHTVHQAFLVRADWESLRDERLLEQVLGERGGADDSAESTDGSKPAAATIRELTAEERRDAGLPAAAPSSAEAVPSPEAIASADANATSGNTAGAGDVHETYAAVVLPLLNRVIVRGVLHAERRERPAAYEVAWELAPRLGPNERMAASWSPLERDAVGRQTEGDRQSYAGCGGWLGVYEIDDASGLLLIESRMVLYEPETWFSGTKLLRSKLPLSIQENARTLRRKLAR